MENATNPGQQQHMDTVTAVEAGEQPVPGGSKDRRLSDEWGSFLMPSSTRIIGCCKSAPSRFQKRKGSIYATPGSRDGHVDKNYAEKYHAKIAEMKGGK
ncbi:hypothetical protein TrVFT333_009960 [Trichoderma virens FT-333]|nr:hypothetical protein TrVFT333_009960 [Trichoderma virens FT-333]